MNNEICRNEIETAAHQLIIDKQYEDDHEDTGEPTDSIFSCSPVVAEYDEHRAESRRKNIAAYCRKQNRINKAATKLKAEQAMAKEVEASK